MLLASSASDHNLRTFERRRWQGTRSIESGVHDCVGREFVVIAGICGRECHVIAILFRTMNHAKDGRPGQGPPSPGLDVMKKVRKGDGHQKSSSSSCGDSASMRIIGYPLGVAWLLKCFLGTRLCSHISHSKPSVHCGKIMQVEVGYTTHGQALNLNVFRLYNRLLKYFSGNSLANSSNPQKDDEYGINVEFVLEIVVLGYSVCEKEFAL